ncbi:iron-siderophore ABC transporter substrate-binding protein [Clostridium boliviensis]|uniref:Iron-siderophore ABC transporter substrate-binding protein n=1 Tax=Clostridium boliviensis TaxID=318465 RepID=A0ABU4GI97_9CLOT|nr:iron-siderophore ABC transporter substrate-binding protein [Clostridium boliviensis]MDW2797334.1 iron-siderophore ABC transporter substrate-binding protein [Clostridium boliviensis]
MKLIKLFTGLMVLTALLSGCGSYGTSAKSTAAETATVEKTGEATARVIEHAMGTTEIEGTPLRVVTLFQGATDSALLLGIKPLGAVESWAEKPVYEYLRGEMDGVVNLGIETQPNLEEIIALKPDLIIASKVRHEKIYSQLTEIAPTVMVKEVYQWKDTLNICAKALNKEEEEKAFLTKWNEKTSYFKEKAADQIKDTKVAVIDFRADHARIVYTGFAATVLDDMGIERPESHKKSEWGVMLQSEEAIPQMEADLIFDQTNLAEAENVANRDKWISNPLWSNLSAVKNNRVYPVNSVFWNSGGGPQAAMHMLEEVYAFYGVE